MDFDIEADETVSSAVTFAVAAVEGVDPCSLRPLNDVLDPDALDALFDPGPGGTPRIGGRVSFVYSQCRVTVENGEYLTISLLERSKRRGRQQAIGGTD